MNSLKFTTFFVSFTLIFSPVYAAKKAKISREPIRIEEVSPKQIAASGFADVVEKLIPAVVNISSIQVNKSNNVDLSFLNDLPQGHMFEDLRDRIQKNPNIVQNQAPQITSVGSGFLISSDGYIVTNNHVIESAKEITVSLSDGKKYKAKVLGSDKKTDLSLLKIDAEKALPFVEFGDSTKARIGDWIIIIGNPYSLGGSVSVGIVSANNRSLNQIDNFIQTDAAINKGNSGGPMFNMRGEVIGVSTALFSPSGGSVGIGFANPSSVAAPIIAQLKESGEVVRGWIGVSVQNISEEFAKSLAIQKARGAFVIEVVSGSPAYKSGIIQGDVILQLGDKEINDMKELPRIVAKHPVGKKLTVLILRNGETKSLEVEIGQMPEVSVKKTGDNT